MHPVIPYFDIFKKVFVVLQREDIVGLLYFEKYISKSLFLACESTEAVCEGPKCMC